MQFVDRLLTMFNILLIIAGVLEYILLGIQFHENFANTYLGGILIGVAFLNAFIDCKYFDGYRDQNFLSVLLSTPGFQVQKSEAILASFLAMIPPTCRVVRDGSIMSIPAATLVKGDIILLVRSSLNYK